MKVVKFSGDLKVLSMQGHVNTTFLNSAGIVYCIKHKCLLIANNHHTASRRLQVN